VDESGDPNFLGKGKVDLVETGKSSQYFIVGLQVADYCLWSLHRVYHHKDFRYYHYLQDKISLVHDLSYGTELYGTYFNKKKPITKGRFGIKK
jgi:hypothetical protein